MIGCRENEREDDVMALQLAVAIASASRGCRAVFIGFDGVGRTQHAGAECSESTRRNHVSIDGLPSTGT